MAYGLRTWDEQGKLLIDTSSRLSRVLGTVQITAGVDGSVSSPDFVQGTPFWMAYATAASTGSYAGAMPAFTISGSTLSWSWAGMEQYKDNCTLIYGVY